jgi:death-on-curing protein
MPLARSVPRYPLPAAASLADACEAAALQLAVDILRLHAVVTISLGGRPSLISPALLDSAAHRPFQIFGDTFLYPTGLDQAAALLQLLVQNHAFEDGNKRAALTSCLFFLDRCGYWREVALLSAKESAELEALTLGIATERTPPASGSKSTPLDIAAIAKALAGILRPSRNRHMRPVRTLSGAFHQIIDLFSPDSDR